MEQYILKAKPVNAIQWFKEGDHAAVKFHPYCGYRACPICDGENKNYYYVKQSDKVLYVDPGDWIVEDSEGVMYVYSNEYFASHYGKSATPEQQSPAPTKEGEIAFAEWAGWDWQRVEGKNLWENQKTLEVMKSEKLYETYLKSTNKENDGG